MHARTHTHTHTLAQKKSKYFNLHPSFPCSSNIHLKETLFCFVLFQIWAPKGAARLVLYLSLKSRKRLVCGVFDTFPTHSCVVYPKEVLFCLFFASDLSSWEYSHVGSLVINGSWCIWYFPHTYQCSLWCHSYRLRTGHKMAGLMVVLPQLSVVDF